ncbi:hypothetical protein J5X84_43965 [Streptosporangiaceae bacterium NEAU-GS5]|nr:hypothetical protein [Streptosporangiaceae bacterium NEAU-GS5]
MTAVIWVVVVLVVLVAVGALGYLVSSQNRRRGLQERFGPEYDRTVNEHDSRKEAEEELRAREARFAKLGISPLDAESRASYAKKWNEVQERFVDAPAFAVTEADTLVTAVMAERGYPTENFDQVISDLSVEHGRTLDHYRQAHDISTRASRQQASTEELRQAMVHYRALFEELLGSSTHEALFAREAERDERAAEAEEVRGTEFDARREADLDTAPGMAGRREGELGVTPEDTASAEYEARRETEVDADRRAAADRRLADDVAEERAGYRAGDAADEADDADRAAAETAAEREARAREARAREEADR